MNETLDELYTKLVDVQKETIGSTFIMGYSTRSNKHYITFSNKGQRFENINPIYCLKEALDWILQNRINTGTIYKYTLFNLNLLP